MIVALAAGWVLRVDVPAPGPPRERPAGRPADARHRVRDRRPGVRAQLLAGQLPQRRRRPGPAPRWRWSASSTPPTSPAAWWPAAWPAPTSQRLLAAALGAVLAGLPFLLAATGATAAVGGIVLTGAGIGALFPLTSSLHVQASGHTADTALGEILTIAALGEIVGPLLAGAIAQATSLRAGLVVLPALTLLAAAGLTVHRRHTSNGPRPTECPHANGRAGATVDLAPPAHAMFLSDMKLALAWGCGRSLLLAPRKPSDRIGDVPIPGSRPREAVTSAGTPEHADGLSICS